MHFKQLSRKIFYFLFSLFFIYSCGIDERGQRKKEEEKNQQMDSLFKDADKIPVMESEQAVVDTTNED